MDEVPRWPKYVLFVDCIHREYVIVIQESLLCLLLPIVGSPRARYVDPLFWYTGFTLADIRSTKYRPRRTLLQTA
jgi:hypothetical protein